MPPFSRRKTNECTPACVPTKYRLARVRFFGKFRASSVLDSVRLPAALVRSSRRSRSSLGVQSELMPPVGRETPPLCIYYAAYFICRRGRVRLFIFLTAWGQSLTASSWLEASKGGTVSSHFPRVLDTDGRAVNASSTHGIARPFLSETPWRGKHLTPPMTLAAAVRPRPGRYLSPHSHRKYHR